jgi:hypothetical protein
MTTAASEACRASTSHGHTAFNREALIGIVRSTEGLGTDVDEPPDDAKPDDEQRGKEDGHLGCADNGLLSSCGSEPVRKLSEQAFQSLAPHIN